MNANMNKTYLFILILLVSLNALADDLKYKLTDEKVSFLVQDEISYAFQQQGFWPLDITQAGQIPLIDVDQVFIDSNLKKTVYFKYGIELNKPQTWLKIGKDIVYHVKTPDGVSVAIFFEDTTQAQAEAITKTFWVIPDRDVASSSCSSCQSNSFSSIKNISSSLSSTISFQNIYSCLADNIKNEINSAKNMLSSIWQAVKNPSAAWTQVKKMGAELITVVRNIGTELNQFFKNVAGLGVEIIKYIGCMVAGKVASSIATAVLTGGAGAFKAVAATASILLMISKLNKMKGVLRSISALKNKRHSQNLLKEVLACGR
jgi:hypothetical protein